MSYISMVLALSVKRGKKAAALTDGRFCDGLGYIPTCAWLPTRWPAIHDVIVLLVNFDEIPCQARCGWLDVVVLALVNSNTVRRRWRTLSLSQPHADSR